GEELAANARVALCFHWKSLLRQVRIEGPVAAVTAAEADAYFATRPRQSQIAAWASDQSRPVASRAAPEARLAAGARRVRRGTHPAAAALVRLARCAGADRILAGPPAPASRPACLHPRW